jgi:hypothetical protein
MADFFGSKVVVEAGVQRRSNHHGTSRITVVTRHATRSGTILLLAVTCQTVNTEREREGENAKKTVRTNYKILLLYKFIHCKSKHVKNM